jgi:hypothetical protein
MDERRGPRASLWAKRLEELMERACERWARVHHREMQALILARELDVVEDWCWMYVTLTLAPREE